MAAWDGQKLSDAVVRESAANKVLKEAREALSKAVQKTESLGEQLKQIGGGVCPFLKETCRQFDPAKVQSDVTSLNEDIEKLESRATDAEADFSESKKVLESLKNTESQVTVKKSSLASRLKEYSDEARELFPAEVREAAVKLGGFVKRIPDLPMPPQVAENNDLSAGAIPALHASVEGVLGETERWWGAGDSVVGEVMEVFEQEKKARVREEQQLKGLEERRAGIGKEIEGLREQAEKMETDAKRLEGEALVFGKAVEQLDGKLAPYAGVDDSIKAENANRDKHRNGHQSFLKAKSVADELATRQQTRGEREEKRKLAAEGLEAREKELAAAARAFDAKALADAKKSYDKKREALVEISTHLGHAKTELKREKLRFKEWESARKEKESHDDEIGRLEAALDVTEFARRTLQRAAPAVAQHLCDRIAARAQIVFNQISTDPIELNWDARRYGLRIVPGDRRFAMLSGGEQTKLALALTLAMIEEFGGLKFCIFDEPTYGVDADSRQKLADAILEAQSAAGLEQLLLVSHDDAFEGKIEHAVMLKKTAAAGSELVEVG